MVNNADKRQTEAAKARVQEAKSSVMDWNEKLSEAYGLGENGYWNSTQQPITQQSQQMRANPEHAYGIGQYSPAAEQPKPAAISGAAGSAKGRQIMQLQDTLVHNPGMSDSEKSTLQEKINNLTAEKEVLDWKDANPGTPTVENYEAQKDYYNRLWQQNQDAIVNGLGNGTIKQGSDEWYELFKKGDDLLAMKDAYNRGMMGQLDGEKAQTADNKSDREGEGDQNPEKTNESKALNDLIKTPGYEEDEDSSDATEITIDFTDPEYEQLRSRYSFWKDGNTIAEDLANHIMENYPAIAEKWGYERLANEIDLHYKLYRLGIKTDRTEICNISVDNDSSWDLIDAYTRFSKALGKNLELPL